MDSGGTIKSKCRTRDHGFLPTQRLFMQVYSARILPHLGPAVPPVNLWPLGLQHGGQCTRGPAFGCLETADVKNTNREVFIDAVISERLSPGESFTFKQTQEKRFCCAGVLSSLLHGGDIIHILFCLCFFVKSNVGLCTASL